VSRPAAGAEPQETDLGRSKAKDRKLDEVKAGHLCSADRDYAAACARWNRCPDASDGGHCGPGRSGARHPCHQLRVCWCHKEGEPTPQPRLSTQQNIRAPSLCRPKPIPHYKSLGGHTGRITRARSVALLCFALLCFALLCFALLCSRRHNSERPVQGGKPSAVRNSTLRT
jgi:hypothetical protein